MAQADLLVSLVKNASSGDQIAVRKVVESLIQEEKNKGHRILADRLTKALDPRRKTRRVAPKDASLDALFHEVTPERSLNDLVLGDTVHTQIKEVIEEQHRSELLHSFNLKPRNRFLFAGPPGNGKTTLAEALAYELMYPLLVVRYDTLVGSYLGETTKRLKSLFDYAKNQRCVLFFDEFETLGKERGDYQETGEIKRVVSSLLLQIDALPDYVVVVAATNHDELLDRAVWRRFQVRVELPKPTQAQLVNLIDSLAKRCKINFGYQAKTLAKHMSGLNFSEVEEFCLSIVRRAVLEHQMDNAKHLTKLKLSQWKTRLNPTES